jgi:hypothetical protein
MVSDRTLVSDKKIAKEIKEKKSQLTGIAKISVFCLLPSVFCLLSSAFCLLSSDL